MPINISTQGQHPCCVELIKPTFWQKEIGHNSNGIKLHKLQESAASAVGEKQQAGEGWKCNTNIIIYNGLDG